MNEQESITSSGDYLAILREMRTELSLCPKLDQCDPSHRHKLRFDALDTAIAKIEATEKVDENGLKACPFCGAEATLETRDNDLMDEIGEDFGPDYIVDCSSCPIQTYPQPTPEAAITYWNARSKS